MNNLTHEFALCDIDVDEKLKKHRLPRKNSYRQI